jgi:hypothetical protein
MKKELTSGEHAKTGDRPLDRAFGKESALIDGLSV